MSHGTDPHTPLGPVVRRHRTRWSHVLGVAAAALALTAAGALAAARFAGRLLADPSGEVVVLGLLTTAPFLAGGAVTGVWAFRRMRRVIELRDGGFRHRDGGREHAVPWASIDGVYQKIVRVYRAGVEVDVRDQYLVRLRDGTTLELDYHFEDIEAFGAALTGAVTEVLLPVQRAAFEAGATLDFGPIQIDRGGVHAGGKTLPWSEVEGISWKAGILASDRAFLMVRRRGGLLAWAKVPVEQIKNYPVLMAIAADLGKAEPDTAAPGVSGRR